MGTRAKYNSTPPTVADGQWTDLQVDASGRLLVSGASGASSQSIQGPAADDAAAVGNPVLVGGKYEATPNAVEDGDVSNLKVDANGNLKVAPTAYGRSASATFTPAAASHTGGDVVGGAQALALGVASGGRFKINTVTLEIDTGTIETTAWTLHLYSVTPPSALADDAAFDLPSGDRASYLGSIAIAQVVDLGSTLWIEAQNVNKQIKLSGTGVFAYLVNGTTLTPAAVAHIVTIHGEEL